MDSKLQHGSSEYIKLDGNNVGASMRLNQRSIKGEPPKDCCCINVYVNNNVQGVSNSVMDGSKIEMRDPGVSLHFEDFKFAKRSLRSDMRVCLEDLLWIGFCFCILILFAFMFLIVLLALTRVLILLI